MASPTPLLPPHPRKNSGQTRQNLTRGTRRPPARVCLSFIYICCPLGDASTICECACRGTQAATGAACKAAGFAPGGFSLNPLIMVGVPLFGGVFPRSGAGLTLPESGLVPLR